LATHATGSRPYDDYKKTAFELRLFLLPVLRKTIEWGYSNRLAEFAEFVGKQL